MSKQRCMADAWQFRRDRIAHLSFLTEYLCCPSHSPDTKHIFVNVGFGFHAELTLEEAMAFITKKEAHLQKYGSCDQPGFQ